MIHENITRQALFEMNLRGCYACCPKIWENPLILCTGSSQESIVYIPKHLHTTLLRYFSVKPSGDKDLGKNLARLLGQIDWVANGCCAQKWGLNPLYNSVCRDRQSSLTQGAIMMGYQKPLLLSRMYVDGSTKYVRKVQPGQSKNWFLEKICL